MCRENIGLSERHKLARVREIFQPYHDRFATELDRRREAPRRLREATANMPRGATLHITLPVSGKAAFH